MTTHRRTVLALGVAAAGTLAGCSTDDTTTPAGSDGDTATQPEVSAPEDEETDPPTPVGPVWGQITVEKVQEPVTVAADPTYPDGNSNPVLDQALSEAAEEGTGGVGIETRSAFEAVEATLEPYPSAPETVENDGTLLRWESEYYVVTLVKLD